MLLLSNSCNKKQTEIGLQSATYFYKNTFTEAISIEVYDKFSKSCSKYQVLPFDTISFVQKQEGQTYPFRGTQSKSVSGDSVVIRFKDRCTSYALDNSTGTYGGKGVFNLTEYDNFSLDIVNQKSYKLFYSIDSTDYKKGLQSN